MDNSKLYCNVFFNYSVEGIPECVKKILENQFMAARDEAIKLLNPHYEEWNAEYGKEIVTEDDEKKYNAFIQNKQNKILAEFNKTWMGPVKLYAGEDADIAGKFKVFRKEYTMRMSIKVLNEKEYKEYWKNH